MPNLVKHRPQIILKNTLDYLKIYWTYFKQIIKAKRVHIYSLLNQQKKHILHLLILNETW